MIIKKIMIREKERIEDRDGCRKKTKRSIEWGGHSLRYIHEADLIYGRETKTARVKDRP